jgi:ferric-dicitrate binding protein FerR (iron transport regulator)
MTTDNNTPEEQDIARLLKAAGKREELPAHLKMSWEASFREQLAPVIHRRKWRRRKQVLALCASLAFVALASVLALQSPTRPDLDIRVGRTLGGALVAAPASTALPARNGQALEVGSVLTTPAGAHLSVHFQGYDLRLNSHTRIRVEIDGVHLLAGEIYVTNDSGSKSGESISVHTPYATVRDIGTQFTVALVGEDVISTVRRGSIVVDTGVAEHTAVADSNPRRVVVNPQRELRVSSVSAEQWSWIYALAPSFELDGSSAYEFLLWSVAETGRELVFASDGAETYARITRLHGTIPELDPEQHLAPVLASTHLQAKFHAENTLLVELLPR